MITKRDPGTFYQLVAHEVGTRLVLRLLLLFCVCLFAFVCLCVSTYHVCNNYYVAYM